MVVGPLAATARLGTAATVNEPTAKALLAKVFGMEAERMALPKP